MDESLIIFVKNLIEGKVKTRLAKTIGNQNSLRIYGRLIEYTKKITESLNFAKIVYYSNEIESNDIWDEELYQKKVQSGITLGDRLNNAFASEFETYDKIVLIGSDCLEISEKIILNAFSALDSYDVCIGPAKDGGYYLIGLKENHSVLFQNKKWSTEEVFTKTITDIVDLKLNYYLLPELSDIDEFDDLRGHKLLEDLKIPYRL